MAVFLFQVGKRRQDRLSVGSHDGVGGDAHIFEPFRLQSIVPLQQAFDFHRIAEWNRIRVQLDQHKLFQPTPVVRPSHLELHLATIRAVHPREVKQQGLIQDRGMRNRLINVQCVPDPLMRDDWLRQISLGSSPLSRCRILIPRRGQRDDLIHQPTAATIMSDQGHCEIAAEPQECNHKHQTPHGDSHGTNIVSQLENSQQVQGDRERQDQPSDEHEHKIEQHRIGGIPTEIRDAVELHRRTDLDQPHHDFDRVHPATTFRQLLQETGNKCQHEERRGECRSKRQHSDDRPIELALGRRHQQCSRKRKRASERGQRKR